MFIVVILRLCVNNFTDFGFILTDTVPERSYVLWILRG